MLHILHSVHTEWNQGTAGAEEQTEEESHNPREAARLVGEGGGYLVTVGTSNGDWIWSEQNLQWKKRILIM